MKQKYPLNKTGLDTIEKSLRIHQGYDEHVELNATEREAIFEIYRLANQAREKGATHFDIDWDTALAAAFDRRSAATLEASTPTLEPRNWDYTKENPENILSEIERLKDRQRELDSWPDGASVSIFFSNIQIDEIHDLFNLAKVIGVPFSFTVNHALEDEDDDA